jgi:hypothetical protein
MWQNGRVRRQCGELRRFLGSKRRELKELIEHRAWQFVGEYVALWIPGSSVRRPELDRLRADAHRHQFDAVIVWKFDRFARSVSHLLRALEKFQALGIDLEPGIHLLPQPPHCSTGLEFFMTSSGKYRSFPIRSGIFWILSRTRAVPFCTVLRVSLFIHSSGRTSREGDHACGSACANCKSKVMGTFSSSL